MAEVVTYNMLREHVRRGFSIHQKVVLEIDFSGSLWGYTEITILPTSSELKTIYLHSRQCTILSVTVAGHPAEFTHHDPLINISMGAPEEAKDCHRHPELKRKVYSALQESDEGELAIVIPKDVSLKQSGHFSGNAVFSEVGTPEPQTPGFPQSNITPEFSPITIHIAYSLRNPADGFEFVVPTETQPYRVPHAFTTPSSPDAARCWVPCVDNLWERCTWEFEFVVPRFLEERELKDEDDESADDANPTIVVCSGELVEQVAHPYNSNKTIFLFSQSVLTSVQHIAFAAGPFQLHSIPSDTISDEASGSSQPLMYAFCLPGYESFLSSSTSFLRSAMSFYSTEFGSYPFGSYKLVFVDQLPCQRFDSATMSIVTVDLLQGEDAIEQAVETRQVLGHALACQWSGINIIPKNWSDLWLVNGLALYITGLFMRKLFGNNEYRFRMKKDMDRVLELDARGFPPICQPRVLEPPDAATLPFINLKAPLVLHILDRRLGKSGTSLGLSRILPKLFLSAISGELPNNALSTHTFLRICRKVSGTDPTAFASQWIFGSGAPSFEFHATFNRKKMAVEITMKQSVPAYKSIETNEVTKALRNPVPSFEGPMTIRIHEADGTPYEHVLDISGDFKRYEVPFNTKYKRVRRNTKRYLARQAAAQAAAEGDTEAAEAMGMVDMGFGLEIWEKEQERENWKVADWTEEDESIMSGATYEWIRMDADFEWIAEIKFDQPDFMWVSQLQRDRDVVAQLEAIHALANNPTAIVSSTLTKTVLVSNYYYRIRCEAAFALVNCAILRLDFLGLFHLFKLFLRYCYDPEDPNQDLFNHKYVPKPNDFSDLPEYFVRKSLINAISRVRFDTGKTPSVVRQFLIDQLRYNDNTANPYSDGFYICTIISAAACAVVSMSPPERGELLPSETRTEHNNEDAELVKQIRAEVDRYRSMDRLIPSPHNIVTIAAIEFYMMLGLANLIPPQTRVFFPLTRAGNYTQVRTAAFDGLFLTKWYTPQIMRYVLAVIANDPSRVVRRHVARNICHSLALLMQMGEMKSALKDTESLLIEEDGNLPEKTKESRKSEIEVMLRVLRKDREIGKSDIVREFLMPIALAPGVDLEVRWSILKLADILIRPVEETPPTVKIHIPITPSTEFAPQLPPPKVAIKPPRVIKSGAPLPTSPLVSFNVPSKLVVPPAPPAAAVSHISAPASVLNTKAASVSSGAISKAPKGKDKQAKAAAKPVHIPKAQSGGMPMGDLQGCRSALRKLKMNKHAQLFQQPVDPIRDHAPNYFDIIKEPMDLSTMSAKLESGMYKDRSSFQADFCLMVGNSKLYNAPGSFVHNEAIALETYFEKQWAIINKTLEAADKTHAAHPVKTSKVKPSSVPKLLPAPAGIHEEAPAPSSVPSLSVSRPSIKLKVGSQMKTNDGVASDTSTKPKGRKPKAVVKPTADTPLIDAPPPPYVDDGSHDLLQEVIAVERELAERHRSTSEKARDRVPINNTSSGKRKITDVDEDEILALTTPAKKEKLSGPSESSSAAVSPTVAPSVTPKSAPTSTKSKKERIVDLRHTPATDVPVVTLKGKAKEAAPSPVAPNLAPQPKPKVAASPAPQPKPKKPVNAQGVPINEKKCKDIMKALTKLPESVIFLRPVDPVLDGCPTYLDEIEHPMDFGTISSKLTDGQYRYMEDLKKDVDLVFANCRQFNPVKTYPVLCADAVEKVFKKEWTKALEQKLSWSEKRGIQGILSTLLKEPISFIFREPVDPIRLNIPTYFDVIPRKDARDLRTIKQKLDQDKYETVDAFEADVELMVENAIKFNGADSEAGVITIQFEHRFQELLNAWKSGATKKRKDGESGTPQPNKKQKTG